MRLMANDEKAMEYFASFFDDDDGDEEYVPVEEWKQVRLVYVAYTGQKALRNRSACM